MVPATTLTDLATIRAANFDLLDSIRGQRGTALGFKNRSGAPAVLVFVERKIGENWLAPGQAVPKTLVAPGGLECPTDVIAGESERDLHLRVLDAAGIDWGTRPLGELVNTEGLSPANVDLLDELRGASAKLTPGCQLAFIDRDGAAGASGTLACFVEHKISGDVGFLTNHHIGWAYGNRLWFPDTESRCVGRVEHEVQQMAISDRYGATWAKTAAAAGWSTVDAAFCRLALGVSAQEIDLRLPTLELSGTPPIESRVDQQLGQPLPFDPDTSMGPVGQQVLGVGRTRGFQQGTIVAWAFENRSDQQRRSYSDFLIIGEGNGVFSAPGNSGTLVVTKQGLRPVALVWAGDWARRQPGRGLQDWTHATEINYVLEILEVRIRR